MPAFSSQVCKTVKTKDGQSDSTQHYLHQIFFQLICVLFQTKIQHKINDISSYNIFRLKIVRDKLPKIITKIRIIRSVIIWCCICTHKGGVNFKYNSNNLIYKLVNTC